MNVPVFLNDVTTTPEEPPQFRALERVAYNLHRDMKYPAHWVAAQKRAYPDLLPLRCDLPPTEVFALVQAAALESRRWEIAAVEASLLQLEATVASGFPWFNYDIVIQVRAEGSGCTVHMRSKSRIGHGALGSNARRIRRFFSGLRRRLQH